MAVAADEPLYRMVVRRLKADITAGLFAIGSRLPSEEALCRRFEVSRHTVREALRQLRDDGLVNSRQGAGTTVLRREAAPLYVHSVGSVEELIQYAVENRYRVEEQAMLVADEALAARLGTAVGSRWLRIDGFRHAPGEATPFCWTEVYVAEPYAGVGTTVGNLLGPIYGAIEAMYGVQVQEIVQSLSVIPMPDAVAAALGAEAGSAAVEVRRAYRIDGGGLAEVAFNCHPAGRFSYSLTLRRER